MEGTRNGKQSRHFPIVGIGASAGGLEAFTDLLKHLPLDTGLAFVVVQHLDPRHDSALPQLLTRATSMPVREVTHNLRVEANHVYVIPPNTRLAVAKGVLKLQPRPRTDGALRSIDFCFESLAQDKREQAIGVILSGTANDGTLGLEAIKAEGGITFAQDASAKYDSMPRSAVAAGCVDFVLSPENIAKELVQIAKHPYVAGRTPEPRSQKEGKRESGAPGGESPLPAPGHLDAPREDADEASLAFPAKDVPATVHEEKGLSGVLSLLRSHTGVEFSLYKLTTIKRRISRRVVLNKKSSIDDYATFLKGNVKELDALYADALINVTSFFRNAEVFDVLTRKVFPKFHKRNADEPFRAWVLGCSTGQEAYSLAMAFMEAAEKGSCARKLQVFATDLNEAALETARHGFYAKSIMQNVSPERLRSFFTEEEGGYRVIKSLREMVVFARQNLINDPPFSRMDLISCRNLLIYLEPTLQKQALPTFHYALKPGGLLVLGASESIGTFTDLFEPFDKKAKIYSKKAGQTPVLHLPIRRDPGKRSSPDKTPGRSPSIAARQARAADAFRSELNPEREADRVTVNQFAPPGVLINGGLQILQFRGSTSAYLQPPTGQANFDLLEMAREGLMLPLLATINLAKKENQAVRKENVAVKLNGKTRRVHLEVVPLKNLKERCFLVLFEAPDKPRRAPRSTVFPELQRGKAKRTRSSSEKKGAIRVVELEQDLAETRDYLQSIQEYQKAAREELQASNEESQSANEELQSLNEELEASKEELESTNEELTTVNQEMANKNAELNQVNSDLVNLQSSAKLSIVLLGRDLTIRRFSAQAEKQFSLLATDVGRPLSGVRHNLEMADLNAVIAEVIANARESESEVRDKDGRWYSLRISPYITLDNKVEGAVMILVDISVLKWSEQAKATAWKHTEAIIRTMPDPLVILNADLRVQSANDAFYRAFKLARAGTEGRSILELGHGSWNIPRLRQLLEDIIPRNSFFNDYEITHNFEGIGKRTLLINARALDDAPSKPEQIFLGIRDITKVLSFQVELRRSELRYRRLFESAHDGVLLVDAATRKIVDANPFITELLGYSHEELRGKELFEIGLLADRAASEAAFRQLQTQGFIRYDDLPLQSRSGERREVEFVSNLYYEDGEQIIQCNIRDITERKQAKEMLRQAQLVLADRARQLENIVVERTAELTATNKELEAFVYTVAHDLRAPLRAMQGLAQILQEEYGPKLDGKGDGYTKKIAEAAKSLDQLLRDLLEYSRISQTKIVLQPVELGPIVASALAQCREKILESHSEIEVVEPLANVLAYGPTLTQVLINLVMNAMIFVAPDVQPRIRIRAEKRAEAIRIWVEDNGIGIEPEHQKRIFRVFERGHTKSFPGTGIGLAIVEKGVERMGGRVGVESTPDTGSRFWIELPDATQTPHRDHRGPRT